MSPKAKHGKVVPETSPDDNTVLITFKPSEKGRELGIVLEQVRKNVYKVTAVTESGQAKCLGVEPGWLMLLINDLPSTTTLLHQCSIGSCNYSILFTRELPVDPAPPLVDLTMETRSNTKVQSSPQLMRWITRCWGVSGRDLGGCLRRFLGVVWDYRGWGIAGGRGSLGQEGISI